MLIAQPVRRDVTDMSDTTETFDMNAMDIRDEFEGVPS